MNDQTNDQATSYETLMARLVAVVDRLEQGELPLAEALALYEEGVALGAACQRLLEDAELRVRQVVVTGDGVGLRELNEGPGAGGQGSGAGGWY